MKQSVRPRNRSALLRKRAEQLMRASRSELLAMPATKVRALVHELRVHQIELELQNEELRQAQVELAESRDRFSDLYEFAPIGYVTLDAKGRISECNLAAADLLGKNRVDVIGMAISRFQIRESRVPCYLPLRDVFGPGTNQAREGGRRRKDGPPLVTRLETLLKQPPIPKPRHARTALINKTAARSARRKLQELN